MKGTAKMSPRRVSDRKTVDAGVHPDEVAAGAPAKPAALPKTSALAPISKSSPQVQELVSGSAKLLVRVNALQVTSKESAAQAGDVLTQLAAFLKGVEDQRKFFVKPLNDHVKSINALFQGIAGPVVMADAALRKKMLAWKATERAEAERARLAAEKAARDAEDARLKAENARGAKARGKAEDAAQQAAQAAEQATASYLMAAPERVEGVGTQGRWTYEVVDESQVPREYLELDATRINTAIRGGKREIPGLRIFKKEGLVVGGRG